MTDGTEGAALALVPRPIEAGAEMRALARFYPDVTWEGTIESGGMGPGSPRMTATGRGTHTPIQGGRWLVGDYEQDQFLEEGTFVLKWQLHWVVGWDPSRERYRATLADNYGRADVMTGEIQGESMVFETERSVVPRLRLTWDASRAPAIVWRNELSLDGASWTLVEEYAMHPLEHPTR